MPEQKPRVSLGAVLEGLWLPLLFWTVAVLVVTASGRLEIARWTPAAWLLALPVGLRIGARSPNSKTRLVRIEAALAGIILSVWLTGLSILVDRQQIWLWLEIWLPGMVICAVLGMLASRR